MTAGYLERVRARLGRRKLILVYATAVIRDSAGRILFQRRADFGEAWWGLPGGLLEVGESLADCARREALEEVGLAVEPVRLTGLYTGPQYDVRYPNGDEVQQWTAAFDCRIAGGQLRADGREIEAAAFFEPSALPDCPAWYGDMVRDVLAGGEAAAFEPPRPSLAARTPGTLARLREVLGHDPLIWPASAACVRDRARRILLVQRSGHSAWEPPSGLMDLGECAAETVVRAVREQAGMTVRARGLAGAYAPAWPEDEPEPVQAALALFDCQPADGAQPAAGPGVAAARFFDPGALSEAVSPLWYGRLAHAAGPQQRAQFR